MALNFNDRNQISRALRAKEENKQQSLALKKATAEASLINGNFPPHKAVEFAMNYRNSQSTNRSQVLSSYTVDGGVSTRTNTTGTSGDPVELNQLANVAAVSQAQLKRHPKGMQAIAAGPMNISQVLHSPRPPAQINNLYSQSSREITAAMAGGKENSVKMMHEQGTLLEEASHGTNSNLSRRTGSIFLDGAQTSEKKKYPDD